MVNNSKVSLCSLLLLILEMRQAPLTNWESKRGKKKKKKEFVPFSRSFNQALRSDDRSSIKDEESSISSSLHQTSSWKWNNLIHELITQITIRKIWKIVVWRAKERICLTKFQQLQVNWEAGSFTCLLLPLGSLTNLCGGSKLHYTFFTIGIA